jgi:hypothetical protein
MPRAMQETFVKDFLYYTVFISAGMALAYLLYLKDNGVI